MNATATVILLRLPAVIARVGLQKSSIYEKMSLTPPEFPRPLKLSRRAVCWPSSSIDAWIADRIKSGLEAVQQTVDGAIDKHQPNLDAPHAAQSGRAGKRSQSASRERIEPQSEAGGERFQVAVKSAGQS